VSGLSLIFETEAGWPLHREPYDHTHSYNHGYTYTHTGPTETVVFRVTNEQGHTIAASDEGVRLRSGDSIRIGLTYLNRIEVGRWRRKHVWQRQAPRAPWELQ
jgi:hypothetical protein